MDYNDSEFQSHKFPSGEDYTKFSSGLQQFALPKFDLDKVGLRFDTLNETENILGIQTQDERHWIEDFSQGSGVIEFNSGPTESCSLSRHKNVWSEATSSESVEMLLKSVGQDELITEPSTTKETDACYEFGSLNTQMDLNSIDDDVLNDCTQETLVDNKSGRSESPGMDQKVVNTIDQTSQEIMKDENVHTDDLKPSEETGALIKHSEEDGHDDKIFSSAENVTSFSDSSQLIGDSSVRINESENNLGDVSQVEGSSLGTCTVVLVEKNDEQLTRINTNPAVPSIPILENDVSEMTPESPDISDHHEECELPKDDSMGSDHIKSIPVEGHIWNDDQFKTEIKEVKLVSQNPEIADIVPKNVPEESNELDLKNDKTIPLTQSETDSETCVPVIVKSIEELTKVNVTEVSDVVLSTDISEPTSFDTTGENCQPCTQSIVISEIEENIPESSKDPTASKGNSTLTLDVTNNHEKSSMSTQKLNCNTNRSDYLLVDDKHVESDAQHPVHDSAMIMQEFSDNDHDAHVQIQESREGNPSSDVNCGSPTIISSSQAPLKNNKREDGSSDFSDHGAHHYDNLASVPSSHSTEEKVTPSTIPKENDICEEDKSFTFEVNSLVLANRETGKDWKPFPSIPSFETTQVNENLSQPNSELHQISHGSNKPSTEKKVSKGTPKERTRSASGGATKRRTAMEGKSIKEASRTKIPTESDGVSCSMPANTVGASSGAMPMEETRHHAFNQTSITKSARSPHVHSSNLPDLNNSFAPAVLFHQSFTDLQQFQLRAQIFVYGSLIQGLPPDETNMASAFGETGPFGGRTTWEMVWRTAVDRAHNQKSPITSETPVLPRAGMKMTDQTRTNTVHSSIPSASAPRATMNKSSSSSIPSPIMSQTSPLWNISANRDGFQTSNMPLHPYPSPVHHFIGNSSPWQSTSPYQGPWLVSPQTTTNASAPYSSSPISESVQVTSVRESFVQRTLGLPHQPGPSITPTGSAGNIGESNTVLTDGKGITSPTIKQVSSDRKTKKKKGDTVTKNPPQMFSPISQTDPLPSTENSNYSLPSLGIDLSRNVATTSIISVSIPPTHYQVIASGDHRVIFPEEMLTKIEQARLQAEEASSQATSALKHSQDIWNQLLTLKNSGLTSDIEMKLASSAIQAAAAASVAKAAASASKVASEAALQAKLMADAALNLAKNGNTSQNNDISLSLRGKCLRTVTPASILEGKGSVIDSAREISRRWVDSSIAAAKRAENLDAIVKAAELAAEAVSQAGAIVAIGDPIHLTLGELSDAGPDNYWKMALDSNHAIKMQNVQENLARGVNVVLNSDNEKRRGGRERHSKTQGTSLTRNNVAVCGAETELGANSHVSNNVAVCGTETELGANSHVSNNVESGKHHEGALTEDGIKEGSIVEVFLDGCHHGWFTAKVMNVKDGQVYVCYNDLLSDKGSDQLKEWVPIEEAINKTPRIRLAHPQTVMKFEKTRKRQRAAMTNYLWSVDDHVDAWVDKGWREGIIREKSKENEAKFTVYFPAQGDSSVVNAWELRSSLCWRNGQWIDWSSLRENKCSGSEVESPQEKRQRIATFDQEINPQVDHGAKGVDESRKPEKSTSLDISKKDTIFVIGKNTKESSDFIAPRMKRTGLQTEGSRVIFGVPKPGKKRKFMDVSKHYISDTLVKLNDGNDSNKFTKYLIPQGSQTLKNNSKIDSKTKRPHVTKPKVPLGSVQDNLDDPIVVSDKDHSIVPYKDHPILAEVAATNEEMKDDSHQAGPGPYSSRDTNTFSSKRKPFASSEIPSGPKSKVAPGRGKSTKGGSFLSSDSEVKPSREVSEPRRSNRRIQPTSRLLEGLQSSLTVSKIPTHSNDKGSKAPHRLRGKAHFKLI